MAGKIFINYRRGDDPGNTGRLFDRLQDAFAREQLFIDIDNIAPGLDFMQVLDERVAECDVLLAVIGKGWAAARDPNGTRRLDDPDDFVRIEIASALNQGKRVIPVLVGDAHMPRPDELPEAIRPLARRNAVHLTHERFRADMQGLIKALQLTLEEFEAHRRASSDAKWQSEQPQRDTSAAKRRGRMMVAGGTLVVLLIAAALIMARSLNIGSGRLQIAASAVPASADVAAPPSKPAPVSQSAAAAEPSPSRRRRLRRPRRRSWCQAAARPRRRLRQALTRWRGRLSRIPPTTIH